MVLFFLWALFTNSCAEHASPFCLVPDYAAWISPTATSLAPNASSLPPHCQTFENKSSFPAPPAGFDVLLVWVVVVLLVQPPNSSSAATLGANPPDAPGTMGWLANDAHPMSLDTVVVAGFGGCGAALGASAVAHALPPHTSEPDQLLPAPPEPRGLTLVVDAAGGAGFCWAAERLKTDVAVVVVVGAIAG